ncbi:MAG: hypothetical protein QM619_13450 [Micropruina sp.]|uniref:hypothetical protein n=1 Tax=Micropruina sp. TaxID=2737536 RepID=UPI0039E58BED
MPFAFIYVVVIGFALVICLVAAVAVRDEVRRPASWGRRVGAVASVALAALGLFLAVTQVTGTWGELCGSAVGILTYTPDPATQHLDDTTRAAYQACIDRRATQMTLATISLIAAPIMLAVTRRLAARP